MYIYKNIFLIFIVSKSIMKTEISKLANIKVTFDICA